jgi:Fe2+ or Zn2+ uptake regulation protein/plasmid stabilization system protein ParE
VEDITHSTFGDEKNFVSGKEVIRAAQDYEDSLKALFDSLLDAGQLGTRVPEVYEQLGKALLLLYQIATCRWGCRQGDHVVENLVRRFHNSALAALRLMVSGLYDEALGSIRGLAEIVNLLQAFHLDNHYFEQWKASSLEERLAKFSPVRVRRFLEKKGKRPTVNQEVYSKLCENGVHVSPTSIYYSYDFEDIQYVGGYFALPGIFLILNTLAWIVGPCLIIAGHLVQASEEKKQMLRNAAIELLHSAGGITINNYEETFQKFRAEHHHQLVLEEVSKMDEQKWQEFVTQLEQDLEQSGEMDKIRHLDEEEMKEQLFSLAYEKIYQQQRQRSREQVPQWLTAAQSALVKQMKEKMRKHTE